MNHRKTPSSFLPSSVQLATLAAMAALAGLALPAQAQTQSQSQDETKVLGTVHVEAPPSGNSEHTRDYTVPQMQSATGLPLSARETPQSVTVITQQRMQDQQLDTLEDVLANTVGVSTRKVDRGRNSFSARGFAIDKYQIDGQGVNWSGPWTSGEAAVDTVLYDRVEVVRGANGLMTGAGNPSASVNLVRKRADSRTRKTEVAAGVGRWGDWSATVDHSQPLNADASVRARFVAHRQGGDTFVDREKDLQHTLYGVIDADLAPGTRMGAGISHQHSDRDATMWGGLPGFFNDGGETDWDFGKNASANWVYWDSATTNYFLTFDQRLGQRWNLGVKFNRRIADSDSKLFYFSGNSVDRVTGLGWSPSPGLFYVDTRQAAAQVQLDGSFSAWGREHDVVAGVQNNRHHRLSYQWDYDASALSESNFFNWNGQIAEPVWGARDLKVDNTERETALYAATRLRLHNQVSLVLGSRLSTWKSHGVDYGALFERKSSSVWTPYAGLLYDITPEHTVYASYTDIFRVQSQRDVNNRQLDPVTGNSFEIGWKASLLGDRLHTQVSAFQTRQDNLAQADGSNTIIGVTPPAQAYRGAKGAKVNGYELELQGRVGRDWQLGGGYSQWSGKDASGNPLNTTSPRKQLKLFASYDAAWLPGLTLGGGLNWQSRIYTTVNHAPTSQRLEMGQNAYATASLMARYQLNDQFSAQINVDNLFNKKYRNMLGWGQYLWGDPRTIRISARYAF